MHSGMARARWLLLMLPAMCVPVGLAGPPQADHTFRDTIRPFLARHCLTCHNAKLNTGGLNLEVFRYGQDITMTVALFEKPHWST